ncbi:MAG: hypothetical protein LC687_06640 [Actinobacteria bacterium]|nr:hypothetical protein [Actinomycetota bacterium]
MTLVNQKEVYHMSDFGGKLDAHFNNQLDAHLNREEAIEARQDAIDEASAEIIDSTDALLETIEEAAGDDNYVNFWEELSDLMQAGTNPRDDKFIEAARGIYDTVDRMVTAKATKEVEDRVDDGPH